MARIVFSCCGEGQGHSSRTLTISRALIRHGHKVMVLASRRAYSVLQGKLPSLCEIPGLFIVYANNEVHLWRTIQGNYQILRKKSTIADNICELIKDFKPDLAITDFEPFLPVAARKLGIPIISLDHQHVIPHLKLNVPPPLWAQYLTTRAIVNLTHRGELANLVTSFFFPDPPHPPSTHFFPPILREEVLKLRPSNQGHVVVYQTSASFIRLPELLKQLPFKFIIYAFEREGTDGNITFKPRATQSFLEDVAAADWILTNGGYTLMSEALYLGKPVFSVPVHRQFEQWINAYYLEKLGYGMRCSNSELTTPMLQQFIENRENFRKNLATQQFFGNDMVIEKVLNFIPSNRLTTPSESKATTPSH